MISHQEIDKLHNELKIVLLFLMKKGLRQIDAEDIIQETANRYILNYKTIRAAHIRSWLFRVALNLHYDQYRKCKWTQVSIEDYINLTDKRPNPEEAYLEKELSTDISNALSKLKPLYQELLRLKYFHEFSYKEIAHLLNIDEAAVKRNIHRARKKFEIAYEAN